MLTPPYPAESIPDVSAGLLAFNAAYQQAKRQGHVAVCIERSRGRWAVRLDTLTALGHQVDEHDAAVLAESVRDLVRSRVAVSGTVGPVMYGLEGIAREESARAVASAMHAAVYGEPTDLTELTRALVAGAR